MQWSYLSTRKHRVFCNGVLSKVTEVHIRRIHIRTNGEYLTIFEHPMDFIVIIYSMLYRSTSLFLINVHTLCHLIISDWKNTIVLLM